MRLIWQHVWLWSNCVSRFLMARGDIPGLFAARGGAWACRWGPSFWVSFAGGLGARLWCWFHQAKQGFAQIWRVKSRLCLSLLGFDIAQSHGGCEMPWSQDPAEKHVWLLMMVCTWYSSLLARDVLFDAKNEVWLWYHVKYIIISNAMYYTILYMLEWMRKRKHRIGISRTRGLHNSALTAYIYGGIP